MSRDFLRDWWREDGQHQESEEGFVPGRGHGASYHWRVRSSIPSKLYDRYSVPGSAWPGQDPIRGCQVVRELDFDRTRHVCIAPLGHETRLPECCTDAYLIAHGEVRLSNDADRYAAMLAADSAHLEGHVWAPLDLVGLVEDHELAAWHREHDHGFTDRACDGMGWDVDLAAWTHAPGRPRAGQVAVSVPDSIMASRTRRRWTDATGGILRWVLHEGSSTRLLRRRPLHPPPLA